MEKFISTKSVLFVFSFLSMLNVLTFPPLRCLAQTPMVGSLGGEVNVTPLGTATYSIPIEVTPGTNGMQPNIAITYNSAMGRGLLGMGWTLSGFSSISRTHRNHFYDYAVGSINFDGNDRLALDGERLIKLSGGNYLAQNATYGTEIENFTRVTLNGSPSNMDAIYFTAVTDQGQIIEYGHTTTSKLKLPSGDIYSWMVNRVTDADGNYMAFEYERNETTKEIWPSQIKYTKNELANLTYYGWVQFQYTTDPNANITYIGGNPVTTTKLLTAIIVRYGNDIVRQYGFEYDFDRSTRLTAVVLKDENGNELTRTSIRWGEDLNAANIQSIYGLSTCQKYVFDYNGNGIPDLLLAYPLQNGYSWTIKEGKGNNVYESTTYSGNLETFSSLFPVDFDGNGCDGFGYVYRTDANDYTFKVKDFNGSGFEDVYTCTKESNNFLVGCFTGTGQTQFLFIGNPSYQNCAVTNSLMSMNLMKRQMGL